MRKFLCCSLTLAFLLVSASVRAQAPTPLPFSVSVGGNAATALSGKPFASIAQPVAADAEISVGASPGMIIINVAQLGPDGTPAPSKQPAIIILQGSSTGSLAKTMDQQKLAPGSHLMSITADGQTALVQLTIK